MSINIGDNISYQGAKPLDNRIKYDTVSAMAGTADTTLYDGCIAYCVEDDKTYQWKSTNTSDPTTGKWREFRTITDETKINGDLEVTGEILARGDVAISGDLYVNGTEHINDTETSMTSDNYLVLRHNKTTALGTGEHSGIVVHNYTSGKTATMTVDNNGEWRLADNTETGTNYTGISYFGGTNSYYTGLSNTETTVISGMKTAFDADELSECVYSYGYYHYDGTNWYEVSLVDNKLTISSTPITDASLITQLNQYTRYSLIYYRTLTVTTISEVENEPLLSRAETTNLTEGDVLVWDSTAKKAVDGGAVYPTITVEPLVTSTTGYNYYVISIDLIAGASSSSAMFNFSTSRGTSGFLEISVYSGNMNVVRLHMLKNWIGQTTVGHIDGIKYNTTENTILLKVGGGARLSLTQTAGLKRTYSISSYDSEPTPVSGTWVNGEIYDILTKETEYTYHTVVNLKNTHYTPSIRRFLKYAFYGDEVTEGRTKGLTWDSTNSKWTTTIATFVARENWPTTFCRLTRGMQTNNVPGHSSVISAVSERMNINGAVNGAQYDLNATANVKAQIQAHVEYIISGTNIIFLAAGMNDYVQQVAPATFRAGVAETFDYVVSHKATYSDVVVILPWPQNNVIKTNAPVTYDVDVYRQIEYEEAIKRGFSVIDPSPCLIEKEHVGYSSSSWTTTAPSSAQNAKQPAMTYDGMRLTPVGYRVFATFLLKELFNVDTTGWALGYSLANSSGFPVITGETITSSDTYMLYTAARLLVAINVAKADTTASQIVANIDPYIAGIPRILSAWATGVTSGVEDQVPYINGSDYIRVSITPTGSAGFYPTLAVQVDKSVNAAITVFVIIAYPLANKQCSFDGAAT